MPSILPLPTPDSAPLLFLDLLLLIWIEHGGVSLSAQICLPLPQEEEVARSRRRQRQNLRCPHRRSQELGQGLRQARPGHPLRPHPGYKKARRDRAQTMVNQDPMMALFREVHGELKSVSVHVGAMAQAAIREVEIQEKASSEGPQEDAQQDGT